MFSTLTNIRFFLDDSKLSSKSTDRAKKDRNPTSSSSKVIDKPMVTITKVVNKSVNAPKESMPVETKSRSRK